MTTAKLDIIIPTIVRPSLIKTVRISSRLIRKAEKLGIIDVGQVRVVVVVNPIFLNLDRLNILSKIEFTPRTDIKFHDQPKSTAEQSAIYSVSFSRGEWVWFIGDDDTPTRNSLIDIFKLLDRQEIDFWLLNCKLESKKWGMIPYYQIGPQPVQSAKGLKFFSRFGLLTATTTLSCWLINSRLVDLQEFERFHEIQGVYSHTFWLFTKLHDKEVGVADFQCIARNEETPEEISNSLRLYSDAKGRSVESIWIEGLEFLVRAASEQTLIPEKEIWSFREIEIVKDWGHGKQKKVSLTTIKNIRDSFVAQRDNTQGTPKESALVYIAPVRLGLSSETDQNKFQYAVEKHASSLVERLLTLRSPNPLRK